MKKICIKYFTGFLVSQEKWLNKMSINGWRLTKSSKLLYEFEDCNPGKYEYRIEFIAHMSNSEREQYIDFLKELEYNVLIKNINLNYSVGKMRWRPLSTGMGQVSTSHGNYNKELLIIERKNDSKPFELHTELEDLIKYIKPIRNTQLVTAILLIGVTLISFPWNTPNIFSALTTIILSILALIFLLNSFKYSKMLLNYKKEAKLYE